MKPESAISLRFVHNDDDGKEFEVPVSQVAGLDSLGRSDKVTDALFAVEGEPLRDKTVVIVEESRSDD